MLGPESQTFQTVQASSEQTQRLVEVLVPPAVLVSSTVFDGTTEKLAKKPGRGRDADPLVGNVVLHAGLGVDGELLPLVDGSTEAPVVAAGILIVGIVLGVVNVLLGPVAAEPVVGDLELAGTVAEGHESEDAEEQTNGLGRYRLDGAHIDSLGVISRPVSKVDLLHHEAGELLAAVEGLGGSEAKQDIGDVTMAP